MGQSADAYLRYGYMMPEREWDDEVEDEDEQDPASLWFKAHGPDEVKGLDLTKEEKDAWNALPYTGFNQPKNPEAEEYSRRYRVFLDAKSEWLKTRPVPVELQTIGHYEGEEEFLALLDPRTGKPFGAWANWEAVPVNLRGPEFDVDQHKAKAILDGYLTDIGVTPPDDMTGWHLIPNYS